MVKNLMAKCEQSPIVTMAGHAFICILGFAVISLIVNAGVRIIASIPHAIESGPVGMMPVRGLTAGVSIACANPHDVACAMVGATTREEASTAPALLMASGSGGSIRAELAPDARTGGRTGTIVTTWGRASASCDGDAAARTNPGDEHGPWTIRSTYRLTPGMSVTGSDVSVYDYAQCAPVTIHYSVSMAVPPGR